MKYTFYLILITQLLFSQKKTITVIDNSTSLPIENVNVSYLNLDEGTFTNSEGKASINIKANDLKITNINYEDLIIKPNLLISIDSIRIIQKINVLDEVIVNSFSLNKAIKYILENYSNLYVNTPFEKECEFKDIVTVNSQLRRLILTKVNWWDKSYERKKNDVKFRLGAIDYNKNEPFGIFTDVPRLNSASKNGYTTPSSIINTIYLNTLLNSLMPFIADATIIIENSPSDIIVLSFETVWVKNNSFSNKIKGQFIFDKLSKAIIEIHYDVNHKDNIEKGIVKENKKESKSETKKATLRMSFDKTLSNKWSLKTYESNVESDVTYDNKINNLVFKNSIFVLKETAVKKVDNDGLIDLTKPIFHSLPSKTISNSNSILLTEEEKQFIYSSK
jgi:hypothetical protein